MVRGGAGRRDKADPRDLEGPRGRNRVGGRGAVGVGEWGGECKR